MPSVHFLIRLFVFVLLSYRSSLHVLDTSPLSDMCVVNIFFPVCGLFIFFNAIFLQEEIFNFDEI